MYGMLQYNIIVPFLRNDSTTERPYPLYRTHPHLDETEEQCKNDSLLSKRLITEENNPKMISFRIKTIKLLLLLLSIYTYIMTLVCKKNEGLACETS